MDILSELEEFNPDAIIIENLSGNFKNISKLKSYLQNYNNPIIHINLDAYHYPKKDYQKFLHNYCLTVISYIQKQETVT